MTLTRSDRVVFLLGAGFSADSDLPVMARFADAAKDRYFLHQQAGTEAELIASYKATFDFQLECERSARAFLRDWDNIEELYTQADLRRLAPSDGSGDAERLCNDISWVIWDVYRQGIPPRGNAVYPDHLAKCIARMKAKGTFTPTVITTNYDLVAESALSRAGVPFRYPGFRSPRDSSSGRFQFVAEADSTMATHPDEVEVIKLHGSVNWLVVEQTWQCSMITENTGGNNSVVSSSVTREAVLDGASETNTSANRNAIKPALIPPMLGKVSQSRVIPVQWRAAIDAFSRARMIFVVGYSFPETDAFMTRLLAEGLHDNRNLSHFVICDLAELETWRPRLSRMFSPLFLQKWLRFAKLSAPVAVRYFDVFPPAGLLKDAQRVI